MEYKKPQRLSVLIDTDPEEFARKVTARVKDSFTEYEPFRKKCDENEREWRNRHWDEKVEQTEEDSTKPRPNVPVLHSTVENCTADIVDNFPSQIIRGVGNDDDIKALIGTELTRFILQRAKYKAKFEKKARAALKRGEGTLQAFWNQELADGMGDVDIRYLNVNRFAWDKNAEDINDGRFFAIIDYISPEDFYEMYPDVNLEDCFPEDDNDKRPGENYNEDVRTPERGDQVKIINFMWKERVPREVEIDGEADEDGNKKTEQMGHITYINTAVVVGIRVIEQHLNQYEYDRFFVSTTVDLPLEGEPVGLSEIDIHKDSADVVNMIEQQYLCNLQASAEDRFLVDRTAGIDRKALLNYKEKIVQGNRIHEGAVRTFKPTPFTGQALNYKNAKMQEVKEQSGQTDFNIGQTNSGVTSGVGIQSLQAYGDKRSRLRIGHFYDGHEDTVRDVLKLAQTHYTTTRVIRISREAQNEIERRIKKAMEALAATAEQGAEIDKNAVAATVLPQGVMLNGNELTVDFSVFSLKEIDLTYDIEIIPQRANAATSAAINAIIAQLVNSKVIDDPELALELTEFEGKEKIIKKIRDRNDINAKLQAMAQQAQAAAEQAEAAGAMVEQLLKKNEELQRKYWDEKIKLLRQELINRGDGEGESENAEDGELPQTAEDAIARIQAEIQGGLGQGAA
jgi:hypothetical protein